MRSRYAALQKHGVGIAAPPPEKIIVIRRKDALGDVLASSVVADKLALIGRKVDFQSLSVCHPILKRRDSVHSVSEPNSIPDADLDGAYERNPRRAELPFSQMFIHEATQQLIKLGIDLGPATNCKPKLRVSEEERARAVEAIKDHPKPWVFICPRSNTNLPRTIPDDTWRDAALEIKGTKFWLGSHGAAPDGIVDLKIRDIDAMIVQLSAADLMVTVDTGPMHFAAALGIPIVGICQASSPELHLNDQTDFITIKTGDLNCLNCQNHTCPIDSAFPPCQKISRELIASAANNRLNDTGKVAAIVPAYRPKKETLLKCLASLFGQVDSIVVATEKNSVVDISALDGCRSLIVKKDLAGIGYGKNINYAVRQSVGEFILITNDDVFLDSDAVAKMMACMKPGVGIVGCLLRYPDGRIYHAGKGKSDGEKFWHHLDYLQTDSRFKEPVEMDNVCGACVLVRRKAHFDIDGFDENFFMFCEDDDYCLKMKQRGWKILFTPLAQGIHLENQSAHMVGDKWEMIAKSQRILQHKWNL